MPFPVPRRGGLLLAFAALPVLCLAGVAMGVGALSYRWLTNPPGYHHPGAAGRRVVEAASLFERDPQTEHGLPFQEVDFPTADGATLRGWLVPAPAQPVGTPRLGVVFAHARGGDRRNYLDQLPLFRELGATALLFDFREHGLSDGAGRGMGLGTREAADVSAAVRYLRETVGVRRVVVVGHSLGGSAVLLAAAQDPAIDGVIADSAIASFDDYVYDLGEQLVQRVPLFRRCAPRPGWWPRLVTGYTARRIGVAGVVAPLDVVERIAPRPLLLIHGAADTVVAPAHAERLYARAGASKSLWIAPGGQHNASHLAQPEGYRERVRALFTQLGG